MNLATGLAISIVRPILESTPTHTVTFHGVAVTFESETVTFTP